MNTEKQPESLDPEKLETRSLFPVPRNSRLTLATADEEEITAEELLALVFQIAAENPHRKLQYWIRLKN